MTTLGSPAESARRYAERGWAVIPVHTPVVGGCSCGEVGCPAIGKHPRVRWRRYIDTAPTVEEVRDWWRRWPEANIAVVTGPVSTVAVLDVDPRSGGDDALAAMLDRWGALPTTAETLTGGGGRHLWFAYSGDPLPSAVLAAGVELKATGGAVVVPPSLHASGRRYEWRSGSDPLGRELPALPVWLEALAVGTAKDAPRRHPLGNPPARTTEEQREFADLWREVGLTLQEGDRYYLCPFHEDHDPSLHIDAEGCRWFCFGCRRGGGIGAVRQATGSPVPPRNRTRLVGRVGPDEPVTLPGGRRVDVVGESHYQDALLAIAGGTRRYGGVDVTTVAHLEPEPTNRFDADAVAVTMGGAVVGYLRHTDAVRYRPVIDEAIQGHGAATCRARVRGGWDRGHGDVGAFGVVLSLEERY